ncbi:MAG: TonB-dependent receptor, partial [Moraxellaceae bacterium]|nr:TonB-dependent receptor [Moraxellaceae bacterium]
MHLNLTRIYTSSTITVALCTAGMSTLPQYSYAQQADIVEEILVSTQRRAYRGEFTLMETPQTIQTISSELIDQAGVRDLTEALDLSAAVARQNNFGGLWNSFAVRGFAGDENLPSNYLVNGFNAGRGFGGSRDISGIEAVEVLKGPSAALFGRGEPGGAVNLVTKRPGVDAASVVRLSADEFGSLRTDLDHNSGLLAEKGAWRFVGFYEQGDSFRDTIENKGFGVLPSAIIRIAPGTTLLYELEASRREVPFDRGIVAINGQLGLLPPQRFLGEPGDGPMKADVLGHQLELNHELNNTWSMLLGLNYRATSLNGFSTEPELTGSRQRLNRDGRSLTRQRRHRDYDADYGVLRAELNGQFDTAGLTHRIVIGMDSDKFENDQIFQRYRAPVLRPDTTPQQSYVIDVLNPVYGQFPLPAVSPLTDRLEVLKAVGLYTQDQINLTDRL